MSVALFYEGGSGGFTPWNSLLQMVGATGWIYVGYRWNEKALILNFLPQFAIIIPMLAWMYIG